jgi:hypothetical protein
MDEEILRKLGWGEDLISAVKSVAAALPDAVESSIPAGSGGVGPAYEGATSLDVTVSLPVGSSVLRAPR